MKKAKIVSCLLIIISVLMVSIGIKFQEKVDSENNDFLSFNEVNTNNITASDSTLSKTMNEYRVDDSSITAIDMETAPASVLIPPRIEVFDGLRLNLIKI